ncbi:MAG: hypothetical protein ACOYOH_27770 [Paracraurococcus sp.]
MAACYVCLAALKLAAGEVAEALPYVVVAAVHGLAVRRERHGPRSAAGQ